MIKRQIRRHIKRHNSDFYVYDYLYEHPVVGRGGEQFEELGGEG
jgi:hypothetical protein